MLNLGKPMIRTSNKREMTTEEKSELAKCLWNLQLGPEGMNQIMAMVKKAMGLEREGDEIELDLAVLNNKMLWKLHSFISSAVRKEAAATCKMVSSVQTDNVEEQFRERDAGEEDVDIGEEMQLKNFPSVEIEKDGVNGSGSSHSSSDSDSSSSGITINHLLNVD
ncbi:putative NET domain-containing protein [Helianthus annuus]|nr:putative NET domain-containing protein [Helianthus annuus]